MKQKQRAAAWLLAGALTAGLLSTPASAVEGTPSDWSKSEVATAAAAGLVPQLTGDPSYQDSLTREQFAQLVVQTVEVVLDTQLPAAPQGTFQDCDTPAVLQAYQAGIINGVGSGKFAPTQTTNREQIASMIARAVDYLEENSSLSLAPKAGSLAGFSDAGTISSWATESFGRLATNGLMMGTSDTTLSPQAPCTVEQGILLLSRIYTLSQSGETQSQSDVFYRTYPWVLDFGSFMGSTVLEAYESDDDQNGCHYFSYVTNTDWDTISRYTARMAALNHSELAFQSITDNSRFYLFYNPEHPQYLITFESKMLYVGTVANLRQFIRVGLLPVEFDSSAPPQAYYPEGEYPDFGAVTNYPLYRQPERTGSTVQYTYAASAYAQREECYPWYLQLIQSGWTIDPTSGDGKTGTTWQKGSMSLNLQWSLVSQNGAPRYLYVVTLNNV